MKFAGLTRSITFRYLIAVGGILLATAFFHYFQINVNMTTVALAFILFVLASATFFGRNPALAASFAAMLCFNYFFLPPFYTWRIADAQNLVAWSAFTVTAIVAGELSAYARRRALEAERRRIEIERLYLKLQAAFETASSAEAARQSEKLKSALLDAVTHDLRTPLTSIKAAVTTLLDGEGGHRTIELDAESRAEFLEIIDEETDRLNRFIEGTIELARVEAGETSRRDGASNVEEAVSAAVERAASLLKNHRLDFRIEPNLPPLDADAHALAEVFYTLLDNAAKYSPADSQITVAARRSGVGEIEMSVGDEGRGVAPELREKVFDKFFRADKKLSGGLGVGLAIARGIVEAHGGKIRVETGDGGRGARFVFTIAAAAGEKNV